MILLNFHRLHFTHDASESIALNNIHSGALILAGSGMCTGGRVRHHLKKNLWRKECSVILSVMLQKERSQDVLLTVLKQ